MPRLKYTPADQTSLWRLLNPVAVIRDLSRHGELIIAYSQREISANYRGTILGFLWILFNPLITLAIYTVVFGYIFQMRFNLEVKESKLDFSLALFVGLSLYNFLAHAVSASTTVMKANASIVGSINFPLQILPIGIVATGLINLGVNILLIAIVYSVVHGFLYPAFLYLFPMVAIVVFAALGFSWFMAALGVFVRDLPSVVQPLLTILLLCSAIFFPVSVVPTNFQILVKANPLAMIVDQARAAVMYGVPPDFGLLLVLFLFSVLFALLGYALFMKMKIAFSDVL